MYNNAGKSWSTYHKDQLRQMHRMGASFSYICEMLGRSPLAIFCALEKHGLDPSKLEGWQSAMHLVPEDQGHRGTENVLARVNKLARERKRHEGHLSNGSTVVRTDDSLGSRTPYREYGKLDALIGNGDTIAFRHKGSFAGSWISNSARENLTATAALARADAGLIAKRGMTDALARAEARLAAKIGMADAMREGVAAAQRGLAAKEAETFSSRCPPPRARIGSGEGLVGHSPRVALDFEEIGPVYYKGCELVWDQATDYDSSNSPANKLSKEKSIMKLFEIRQQVIVNGSLYTPEQIRATAEGIARIIQIEDSDIKALEAITTPTKALKNKIAERRANLAELVAYVDSLEPEESAKTAQA